MGQVADTYIELSKHPFPLLGSLDSPGNSTVGAYARESLTDFGASGMRALGPFPCPRAYHLASLRLILDLIARDELYSQQAVDAYLIHRFLVDLVPLVVPLRQEQGGDRFYLTHADDKGDHILVDDDFNVGGIIDWEWAHTAPAQEAFKSPIGFLPVGDFYDGKNAPGEDEVIFAGFLSERGHPGLAQHVLDGRLQHRFAFCCGYDLSDWKGFLGLFAGLRDAVGVDGGLGWDEWKAVALRRYADDAGLVEVLARRKTG